MRIGIGADEVRDVAGTGASRLEKMRSDFDLKIADRFQNENRFPIFPEWFLIGITIAIEKINSGSDFKMKIADRF